MTDTIQFPTQLPTYSTPLIGRDREASEITALLRRPDLRMLTLVGSSGAGKTRLALQAANLLAADFPAGRTFVALAPVNDAELVLATIAQTLGVRQTGGASLSDTLIAALRDQRLLLILDNVEQVREAAAGLQTLIDNTSRLTLLVTSQVPLASAGEQVFNVPPLDLPERSQRHTPAALLHYPSVALFVSRMQAVQPDFQLSERNAGAVVEICSRVQGLPLAIELIAAHSHQLAPNDLLLLLRNYLPLPAKAEQVLSREQILTPLLNWCWSILPPYIQTVFARLSVFGGGWTYQAAEHICRLPGEIFDIATANDVLLTKHLIIKELLPSSGEHYEMLDAINEFARQRHAAAPTMRPVQERHALYYLSLIESARQTAEREEKLRLEREYHNVRAALRWFLDDAQIELAARLAGAMGFYWYNWGYWSEGRHWLERVQARMGAIPPAVQALVLKWLGVFAFLQGSAREALPLLESSLDCYKQADDDAGVASVLNNLGVVAKDQGDYAAAERYLGESLALAERLNQPHKIITTLNNLGTNAEDQERYQQAVELYRRSLAAAEAGGSSADIALSRLNFGRMLPLVGRLDEARPHLEEAVRLYQEIENLHFGAAAMEALGEVLLAQGDRDGALRMIDGALRLVAQNRDTSYLPSVLDSWARISAGTGAPERAAFLLFAADQIRRLLELPRRSVAAAQAEALRAELAAQLSEAVFQSSQHSGQAATVDSIFEYLADTAVHPAP